MTAVFEEIVEEVDQDTRQEAEEVKMIDALVQDVMIFEDHVRVTLPGEVEKTISLTEFRNILNQVIGVIEEAKLEGFSLPSNVFYFAKSGSEMQICCYYQSRVCSIMHYDEELEVVFPNLIISHKLKKTRGQYWEVIGSRYFCTDQSVSRLPRRFIFRIDPSERVFLMPTPNMYPEGDMCYGDNAMPRRFVDNNLRGLDWYYQYLFESPFNDDLGVRSVEDRLSPRDWFRRLERLAEEKKPFPYEDLRGYTPME